MKDLEKTIVSFGNVLSIQPAIDAVQRSYETFEVNCGFLLKMTLRMPVMVYFQVWAYIRSGETFEV
jgi:hypothetical protein